MTAEGGSAPTPDRDAGLAAERTDIAWARSGLAALTCLAALLRRVPSMEAGQRWALIATIVVGGAAVALVSQRRNHSWAQTLPEIDASDARLRQATHGVVIVGVLCLGVVFATLA